MSLAEQMDTVTEASAGTVDRHATTDTFDSTDPASGAVVGVFPVHDAQAVQETVDRARSAAQQ
jgi:acyl-CoA reductase-like NAD-dependent aldehyde dehydrogenase